MTPTEIREDLDSWSDIGDDHVPAPIDEWHFANGRYVVDGVPFTKPQVEAFLAGLDKGLNWTFKLAEHLEAGSVDAAIERVTAQC